MQKVISLIVLLLSFDLWADSLVEVQTLMLKKQWDQSYSKSIEYALKAKKVSQMEAVTRLVAEIPKETQSQFRFTKSFSRIELGTLIRPVQIDSPKSEVIFYLRGQMQKGVQVKGLSVRGAMYPTTLLQWHDCEAKDNQIQCETKPGDMGLLGPGLYILEVETVSEKIVDHFFMPESFVYPDRFHLGKPSGFEKLTSTQIAYSILGFDKMEAKNFISLNLSLRRPGPQFNEPVKELRMTGLNFQSTGTFEAPAPGAYDFVFSWTRQRELGPLRLAIKGVLSRFILIAAVQK